MCMYVYIYIYIHIYDMYYIIYNMLIFIFILFGPLCPGAPGFRAGAPGAAGDRNLIYFCQEVS